MALNSRRYESNLYLPYLPLGTSGLATKKGRVTQSRPLLRRCMYQCCLHWYKSSVSYGTYLGTCTDTGQRPIPRFQSIRWSTPRIESIEICQSVIKFPIGATRSLYAFNEPLWPRACTARVKWSEAFLLTFRKNKPTYSDHKRKCCLSVLDLKGVARRKNTSYCLNATSMWEINGKGWSFCFVIQR